MWDPLVHHVRWLPRKPRCAIEIRSNVRAAKNLENAIREPVAANPKPPSPVPQRPGFLRDKRGLLAKRGTEASEGRLAVGRKVKRALGVGQCLGNGFTFPFRNRSWGQKKAGEGTNFLEPPIGNLSCNGSPSNGTEAGILNSGLTSHYHYHHYYYYYYYYYFYYYYYYAAENSSPRASRRRPAAGGSGLSLGFRVSGGLGFRV